VNPTLPPSAVGSVCGYVRNSAGAGIAGVTVRVLNGDGVYRDVTTNSAGLFTNSGFIPSGWAYAVRPQGVPAGYVAPVKTTTAGWSWNTVTSANTPVNSPSYESQKLGTNDCASTYTGGSACRCNFKYDAPAAVCTQCSDPTAKGKGDADCSGGTTINDASIWRAEFISGVLGTTVKNTWQADFDCNGKVTINDISIWRTNFIKGL
jgi:hypothetical protein